MQTLGGPVYLHQFKINTKNAHDGEIWHWHQDYRTWFEDDGMRTTSSTRLSSLTK